VVVVSVGAEGYSLYRKSVHNSYAIAFYGLYNERVHKGGV